MKKTLIIFFLPFLFFSGCKKYPDDDRFMHLRSAKHRLCNAWQPFAGFNYNSNSEILFSFSDVVSFEEKGGLIFHIPTSSIDFSGAWNFTNHKSEILLNGSGNMFDFKINKLESDELWLQNDTMILKFNRKQFP